MRFLINPIRFINSIRHAYGFDVHSPFAFHLILDTIHCPHSYYNYVENEAKLEKAALLKQADLRFAKLLFRLTNRFNSENILEIGSGCGINTLYISASSKYTSIVCVEQNDENSIIAESLLENKISNITFIKEIPKDDTNFDAIFWNLASFSDKNDELISYIQNSIKDEGFIVLKHINKNRHCREIWREVKNIDSLTMSFDLGSIGIAFFISTLPKLNYDVYF